MSLYWIDPITNYSQVWVTYNSYLPNLGVWAERLPGWMAPNGRNLAEPIMFFLPTYIYAMFGGAVLGCYVMKRIRARWPRIPSSALVGLTFLFFVLFDAVIEIPAMLLGLWAYPGAIPELTIFAGHYYQFPLYEAALLGATWTAFACLRYFRNDKGQTIAERGLEREPPQRQNWVQGLAIVGAVNVAAIVVYGLPIQWFALHAGAWPADIQERSYLTNGFCGPGTDYACPGPEVPIPRPHSAHLDPDGHLVPAPKG